MKVDVVYNKSCQQMDELPDESIDMVMTSPPYWGLRDYGEDVKEIWGGDRNCKHQWTEAGGGLLHENRNFIIGTQEEARGKTRTTHIFKYDKVKSGLCQKCGAWYGQLGLEPTLEMYIEHLLLITLECKRVLKPTGVMWWNHGDSYFTGKGSCRNPGGGNKSWKSWNDRKAIFPRGRAAPNRMSKELPPKCLALQNYRLVIRMIDEQGWILRNAAIWDKPNGMPSSVKDRLANKYEPVFYLIKNTKPQYYWNEKTALMADRKPSKAEQIEQIDWEWRECSRCMGKGRIEETICSRCKGTGKIKYSFWHSLGYWCDLDAIREAHAQTSIARLFRGVDPGNKYDYMDNPVEHPTTNLSKPRLNIRKITRGPKEIPFEEQSIRPSGGDHHLISNMLTSLQKSVLAGRGKNPGDVWIIPTQPRPEAHFATFPDALCIKPILATCPAEICKKCGKARVRITKIIGKEVTEAMRIAGCDKNGMYHGTEQKNYESVKAQKPSETKKRILESMSQVKDTIGWTDCGCNAGWDSGVLLDPFAGRGTALIMAKKMGRHYVGYELKREYCEKLIKPALEEIDPLFNWKTPSPLAG